MYEEFKVVLMMMRARSRDELLWLAMSKGRWMYQGMTERMEEEVERSKKRRETFEYIMQGRMGENEEEKRERLKQLEEKAILAMQVPGYKVGETLTRRLNNVRMWCRE